MSRMCQLFITFHYSTLYIHMYVGESIIIRTTHKTKLRGLSPHANYTDRAAAAGRRS